MYEEEIMANDPIPKTNAVLDTSLHIIRSAENRSELIKLIVC